MASVRNPLPQTSMADKAQISSSLRNALRILKSKKVTKIPVHKLLAKHKAIRKTNSLKPYRDHLAGDKSEFMVTLDEAIIHMNEINQKSKILPQVYPDELHKIYVHHDGATAHTAEKTMKYAEEVKEKFGITIMSKSDIIVKSPDGAPLDFFGFGYLKEKIKKRRANTLAGVWKVAQQEWNKIKFINVSFLCNKLFCGRQKVSANPVFKYARNHTGVQKLGERRG